jgi:hypothetical protein
MWISVTTLSIDAIERDPFNLDILKNIQIKINSMAEAGLGGKLMPGYENATNIFNGNLNQKFVVVKRSWNTQEAAETFINYINSVSNGMVTAEIEIG